MKNIIIVEADKPDQQAPRAWIKNVTSCAKLALLTSDDGKVHVRGNTEKYAETLGNDVDEIHGLAKVFQTLSSCDLAGDPDITAHKLRLKEAISNCRESDVLRAEIEYQLAALGDNPVNPIEFELDVLEFALSEDFSVFLSDEQYSRVTRFFPSVPVVNADKVGLLTGLSNTEWRKFFQSSMEKSTEKLNSYRSTCN